MTKLMVCVTQGTTAFLGASHQPLQGRLATSGVSSVIYVQPGHIARTEVTIRFPVRSVLFRLLLEQPTEALVIRALPVLCAQRPVLISQRRIVPKDITARAGWTRLVAHLPSFLVSWDTSVQFVVRFLDHVCLVRIATIPGQLLACHVHDALDVTQQPLSLQHASRGMHVQLVRLLVVRFLAQQAPQAIVLIWHQ